jgi:hypothetical protein
MEGMKKQLEKERIIATEEETNYRDSKKSEVESKSCDIEIRRRHVEAEYSKVSFIKRNINL